MEKSELAQSLISLFGDNRFVEAEAHAKAGLAETGQDPVLLNILGAAQAGMERHGEAIENFRASVECDPEYAQAYSNLGNSLRCVGEYEQAEACLRSALRIKPDLAEAHMNLGAVLLAHDRPEGAAACFRRVLDLEPRNEAAYSNLGAALYDLGRMDEALAAYERAYELQPHSAAVLNNWANVLRKTNRPAKARDRYMRALELQPVYPEATLGLAKILLETQLPEKAVELIRLGLDDSPDHPELTAALGRAYGECGRREEAIAEFVRAAELQPTSTGPLVGLGQLYLQYGDKRRANEKFRQALEIDPNCSEAYMSLATATEYVRDGKDLAELEEAAKSIDDLPAKKRTYYHFALGKAYDDIADYDRAFEHFRAGCAIHRRSFVFEIEDTLERMRRVREVFDRAFIERHRGAGTASELPILILGMPRSGTTLTEQIVAGHSQVFGGGELKDLGKAASMIGGRPEVAFPDNIEAASAEDLAAAGSAYLQRIRRHAPDAARITDKLPGNTWFIGLVKAALPGAKIVHVDRNPLDVCLSNYSKLFASGQLHTYDLGELGRYYRGHAELMDHWRTVLPQGAFYNLSYDALVSDIEGEARALFEYLELPWEEDCLQFARSKRQVRTASVAQVRMPVYTSSKERWRRYEKHLGPLIDALGPYAPPR